MTSDARFHALQEQLSPLRSALLEHPLYVRIDSLDALRLFMTYHVFAVWDFMSLLKVLQRRLCCVDVPWLPPADGATARFINEIVLGEESDEDGSGGYASHFDLYHRAMSRCGAGTGCIDCFLDLLRGGSSVPSALATAEAPLAVRRFVTQTFDVIESGDLCAIASAFTFGREDLLPDVFQRIVDELNVAACGGLDEFKFYLHRHIQLDGDEHGPLARRLIASLCGDDAGRWQSVERAAVDSLRSRLALWDAMLAAAEFSGSTGDGRERDVLPPGMG